MYHLQMFTVRKLLTTSNYNEMRMSLETVAKRLEGTLDFTHGIKAEVESAPVDTEKLQRSRGKSKITVGKY